MERESRIATSSFPIDQETIADINAESRMFPDLVRVCQLHWAARNNRRMKRLRKVHREKADQQEGSSETSVALNNRATMDVRSPRLSRKSQHVVTGKIPRPQAPRIRLFIFWAEEKRDYGVQTNCYPSKFASRENR